MLYTQNIAIVLVIVILILLIFLLNTRKFARESFNSSEKYTVNDIHIYIFSWKRVTPNAIQLYEEIGRVFPNVFFINCDENTDVSHKIPASKLINLDDSYYFGGQFESAMRHCPINKVFANVVGDVPAGSMNWKKLRHSTLHALNTLNAGVFGPQAPNHPNLGTHLEGDYYEVGNTDETIWFITPDVWAPYKEFSYKTHSHFGYGIDTFFCGRTAKLNKRTVRDNSITVPTDNIKGYDNGTAMAQMRTFLSEIENYAS